MQMHLVDIEALREDAAKPDANPRIAEIVADYDSTPLRLGHKPMVLCQELSCVIATFPTR